MSNIVAKNIDTLNSLQTELAEKITSVIGNNGAKLFIAGDTLVPPAHIRALAPGRARLFLVFEGCRRMTIDNDGAVSTVDIRRGDMLFAGSRSWHIPDDTYGNEIMCLMADEKYLICDWKKNDAGSFDDRMSHYFFQRNYSVSEPVYRALKFMDSICRQAENHDCALHLAHAVLSLMTKLLGKPAANPRKAFNTYLKIRNYVQENFRRRLDRDTVAGLFNLHSSHVSRLFREFSGEGFSSYITRLRLELARTMLERCNLTVKEIASRCGFKNANYFGKVFRKHFGYSPGRPGPVDR